MKRILCVSLLAALLFISLSSPYSGGEGTRAIFGGSAHLFGSWNGTTAEGSGFVFSTATVVPEGKGDINIDAAATKIYAPFGGGIKNVGKIALWNLTQAPTTGYSQEVDLTSGDMVGNVFCLYTPELNYAKFQIVEHYSPPTLTPGGDTGYIKIDWYFQDDGSRSFVEQGVATLKEVTYIVSPTMKCSVRASSSITPQVSTLPEEEITSMGIEDGQAVLAAVEVDIPEGEVIEWVYIELSFSDEDIRGMDPNNLAIYYFDEDQGRWVKAENTGVDLERHVVWANVTHLTIFAAMDFSQITSDNGGDNGGGSSSGTMTWAIMLIPVIFVAIVIIGIFFARKPKETNRSGEDGNEGRER